MPMKMSIDIARPPADVWPWLTEFDKKQQWAKGLQSEEWYEGDKGTRGSRFRVKIKEGPSVSEYDGELIEIEEPKRIVSTMSGGCGKEPATFEVEYSLTDLGGTTRLEHECRFDMPVKGFIKLMMPLFMWFANRQSNAFHRKLKTLVESS